MNLETIAPMQHILSLDLMDVFDTRAILVIFPKSEYQGLHDIKSY